MRPTLFIAALFAALGLAAVLIAAGVGWAALTVEGEPGAALALLLGVAGTVVFLFAVAGAWAVLHLRLVRPLEALTREAQTLAHAKTPRALEAPESGLTRDLSQALQSLTARAAAARNKQQEEIDKALERGETFKRRLETILLDLSEGVIVCNLDNRILLYNQAAVQILERPEALGLGRRLFALFERQPVLDALDDLTTQQKGDRTRKLRASRTVDCKRRGGGEAIEARLALICSDEVETEGYVLTFTPPPKAGAREHDLPPRPEFYDFDLFRREPDRKGRDVPLKELRCVAFDTETTGLRPSEGDELISIGAVRVVNGRIVSGETFEQLIDPGRTIPKDSIRFHGITGADVKGKPKAKAVLPRFHRFCGTAALIAHNAAFDMKFFQLKEKEAGVSFTNPVIDVLLLSAFLHDHAQDHSLEACAARLGVEVSGRHTALGDAMTTAAIFLAMLDPLAERGVVTLGDAFRVSRKQVNIRRQQARF